MINTKETIDFFDEVALEYAETFKQKPEETKIVSEFINSLPKNAKILDVGCGNCDFFDYFVKNGIDYTGIDLSKGMIEVAKKMHPRGNFKLGDIRKIDFPDASLDGIFAFFSLIYVPKIDIPLVLKSFNRLLKNNGVVLIALQEGKDNVCVNTILRPNKKLFMNLFTEEEIKEKLKIAGFNVVKIMKRKSTTVNEHDFHKLYILAEKVES